MSTVFDFAPGAGDAKGLVEILTGEDLVTGERLGAWRWLGLLGLSEVWALRHADELPEASVIRRLLPAPRVHYHHIFPQQEELAAWFARKGIDIDPYTVPLEETTHLAGVHGRGGFVGPGDIPLPGRWNQRWMEFVRENPRATLKEIYQFAGQLMDEFGLSGLPIVPYPR